MAVALAVLKMAIEAAQPVLNVSVSYEKLEKIGNWKFFTAQSSKNQWEQQLGVFRTAESMADRRATTAALVHFAKTFG